MSTNRKSSARFWIVMGVSAIILVAAFGLGLAMKINTTINDVMSRTDRPSSVALHFADALRKQDYNLAYADLDSSATFNGQVLDLQTFVKLAAAADSERGNVMFYGILSDENDPAQFNLKLQRGNQSDTVHVRLQPVGDAWKIISIDSL